jgi:heme/copper-type cytochrome/quinol oxidase subunit 1
MLLIHRMFIKTALVYLVLGVMAGAWMLLQQAGLGLPQVPNLFTVHIHLLGLGFFMMMVCGVALWMFPRKSGDTREQAARDPLAWTSYYLITIGLALRCLALLLPGIFGSVVLGASAVLQAGGVVAFAIAIWPRVYLPGGNEPPRSKTK